MIANKELTITSILFNIDKYKKIPNAEDDILAEHMVFT